MAQTMTCPFDPNTLQFTGRPVEQARCLLRPNRTGGALGPALRKLPEPLEKLIGHEVGIKLEVFRKYLSRKAIDENSIGGSLDAPLATAKLPGGGRTPAIYFVIHDTSWPYLKDEPFPQYFDEDANWRGNRLDIWSKNPVAHVFVSRLGESITTTPFEEPVRKGFGTKFARDFLGADAKGLQIHIELVQPRRRDASHPNPENDLIAPVPGFTEQQYERLALLYAAASLRAGRWLIPAYHSAVDAGIKNAHDDPQNFELEKFARRLKALLDELR